MYLQAALEDLDGNSLRRLSNFWGLEVDEPLNDSLVARVTISMHDQAAVEVKPLERVLTVTFGEFLVFRGRLTRPVFDFDKGTIEINAHDITLHSKHHYHAFGDEVVEIGYPIDGRGLRMLLESGIPLEPDYDAGMQPAGFTYGVDETTHQGDIDDEAAVWRRVERGTNVWESVQNLSNVMGAPDFHFRPVHPNFPGLNGVPSDGFFAELDVFDRRGDDKAHLVIFEKNFGRKNCDNIIWEPDGTQVRNFWVQVYPGGDRSSVDDFRRARVLNGASINKYGMMMGWESSGQKDNYKSLEAKARAWVSAYAYPPDYFTVVTSIDRGNTPKYIQDFAPGDTITARAKRGFVAKEIEGRIVECRLRQLNAQTQTRVEIDCVPTVDEVPTIALGQDV